MKHKLFFKFLLVYAVVAVLSFVMISTLGSSLVNRVLISQKSRSLYSMAQTINQQIKNTRNFNSESLYESLQAIASYEDVQILLLDPDGIVNIDTKSDFSSYEKQAIEDFDPVALGTGYYSVGNFFGFFDTETLSVLQPITANMIIRGYLTIHLPMSVVYAEREQILGVIHLLVILVFVLMILLFLLQNVWIYRPLNQIVVGARQMAAGDLTSRINIKSRDEMGELADTLNYMGAELNKTTEYQHKFIANVSHDFRSPLTSIKGYVEAIKDGVIPPEMMDKYLDIVVSETERLNKLTTELLSLDNINSRVRRVNYTDFNINRLIRNSVLSFEGTCREKDIRFTLLLEGDELMVTADYSRIQQVMYNLIDNAIKFSPLHSEIEVETTRKKEKAAISVKDHGYGISSSEIPKIWQRFYKADASRGKDRTGTGLGLSIVKEIIQDHDQKITAVSTEGVGTEFIFTLDLAKSAAEEL